MRLLLDEMFPASIAKPLRNGRREDVVAVAERHDLRGLPDADIFLTAQEEQRAIVTENVRDYRPIAREWQAVDRVHFGLVLTTNQRYPRAHSRTTGHMIRALINLLDTEVGDVPASNREIWL